VALKGTLKDFGIAEILQLIGQQAKSGVLHLTSRDDVIHIAMADGNVVRAESTGRKARERLGNMLVRAEIITAEELGYALEVQKKTLRRLGDILVELDLVTREDLREMTALQTTETVYRLFHWKSGTYQFEPGAVEWDAETVTPIRAESVLMEGYRQVDEWPVIRRKITSITMTFERLRPLDGERTSGRKHGSGDDVDAAFDALGDGPGEKKAGEFASIGRNERRVHDLVAPGRTVENIVDLSRLGEFETCKALLALVNQGYLRTIAPSRGAASAVGAYAQDWQARLRRGTARVLATLATAAALAGIAYWADQRGIAFGGQSGTALRDNAAQRFLARYQMERLRGALEVYRLERGEYPDALGALVETGLATPGDLRYPWSQDYHYRRKPGGRFVLLPPVE
jgi:BMFP domain-containing protein YqiC